MIVSYLPNRVPLPNFPLRYLFVWQVRLSAVQQTLTQNRWEGPAGGLLGGGPWPGLVTASRECAPAASYTPLGLFSQPVLAGPAGAVCACWKDVQVTPRWSWIHQYYPVRCTSEQPITADRGHSFGCWQDEPSASLVVSLLMCDVHCFLLEHGNPQFGLFNNMVCLWTCFAVHLRPLYIYVCLTGCILAYVYIIKNIFDCVL